MRKHTSSPKMPVIARHEAISKRLILNDEIAALRSQ